jgi:DNA polymerase-1
VLYTDTPARIASPGSWPFAPSVNAVYTVGSDFVHPAMRNVFERTRDVSCDIETYGLGLDARRIKSVTFGDDVASVVMDPRDPYQEDLIRKTFAYATTIAFYKSTFDVPSVYLNDLIRLADVKKIVDPLLYARLATPGPMAPKTLEALSDRYLSTGPGGELMKAFKALGITKTEGFKRFDLDRPIYLQGAASDTLILHRITPLVRQHAYDTLTVGHPFGSKGVTGDEAWTLVEREQRINRIFLARSCRGFRVDFDYLDRYKEDNALEIAECEEALYAAGLEKSAKGVFNGQHLARVLEERGEMPPGHPRTPKTGAYQMTAKTMGLIGSPLAKQFIRHGQIKKIGTDYIGKTIELSLNGRVHPEVNLLAAVTGRASYGNPPTHQFSDDARGAVMADEGDNFTSLDLSQGEPCTIANMAKDYQTLDAYDNGVSVYIQLGATSGMLPRGCTKAMCDADLGGSPLLVKQYKLLKVGVLAKLYGEGPAKLSADLGLDIGPFDYPSEWEVEVRGFDPALKYPQYAAARALQAQIDSGWPKTAAFVKTLKDVAKKYGKCITISGRVIPIDRINGRIQSHLGVNYPCQGGQYDAVADTIIKCEDAGLADALYLTMHDEFLVSTSAAHDIRQIMEQPNERLTMWAGGRPARFTTDRADYGIRWGGDK